LLKSRLRIIVISPRHVALQGCMMDLIKCIYKLTKYTIILCQNMYKKQCHDDVLMSYPMYQGKSILVSDKNEIKG